MAARSIAALLCVGSLLTTSCGRRSPSASAEAAVRDLVERLSHVQGDPNDAKAAFALLSKRTQANLEARAKRYSAASGKPIAPEAMIVPWRFISRFEPQRYVATVSGTTARVEVTGPLAVDRAQLLCVLEDNAWHVDLPLPALRPLQTRPTPK